MSKPDIRLGQGKDIVMREFVNDAIKIEMQNTQRHKKPGREACLLPSERKRHSHEVEPDRTHHDPEFLVILNPGIHSLQSSQVFCRNPPTPSWDADLGEHPRGESLQR